MCVYVYEIESRAEDARKVFEQPQAARRQHAGSQTLLQNGELKRKHFTARF